MAEPMIVSPLSESEAVDLEHALAVRGIVGAARSQGARHAIDIHDAHEDTERLLQDLTEALQAWLADRGRRSLELEVGATKRTVRARRTLAGNAPAVDQ